ncbi:hypothetical protein [Rhizobium sp. BR 315]|uniref:Uncharacterized protein n=1 Tax=Rhizobium lusitanum TaxID=293958 RepID=A0A7X0MHG8_9HYPH|nr:hypothetical protein [Rhizobium lusitanum]
MEQAGRPALEDHVNRNARLGTSVLTNADWYNDYLFNKGDWFATQEAWRQKLIATVEAKNGDELLNTSTTDLARYLVSEFAFEVPTIYPDDLVVDQREAQIDISQDQNRWIDDRSRPHYITGTAVDVELPFTGDKVGFDIQPTTSNFNNPRAHVDDGVISFSIAGTDLTAERVRQQIDGMVASINLHLSWLTNDAQAYNASLGDLAMRTIDHRKEKLLRGKSLLAGLGFKMKERPGASQTFAVPSVRRTIHPSVPRPVASRDPYKPEPILTPEDYEHVLLVMENMVGVMEQSPGAFREIDGESLRTHFLVQLNGHFAGDATAETFNYEGKSDILIKVDRKNIFIGECKFWTGEKGYLETLDQVLSYLSWRDTKAAVLIFNRNKDFSAVLAKIGEVTPAHPKFKKLVQKRSESSWTYLFGHKDDANRELTITVQGYNVPELIKPRILILPG